VPEAVPRTVHTHGVSSHCTRGAANPSQPTRYRLWADSAGYCQNPSCQQSLFVNVEIAGVAHFGEIAHVIAASGDGPRGDDAVEPSALGAWDNLILLCANCHTVVDKTAADHPVELLLGWKESRQAAVERVLGITAFATREGARAAMEPYAIQNRFIHRTIGPDNDYRFDPEAEEAAMWQHEVVATIIPNHHRMLRIIEANMELLTVGEKEVVAEYRSHVDGLTHRHKGKGGLRTVRYPEGMEEIFADR
jgi:hypothetical protein